MPRAFYFQWANDRKMLLAFKIDRRKQLLKISVWDFHWLQEEHQKDSVLGQELC